MLHWQLIGFSPNRRRRRRKRRGERADRNQGCTYTRSWVRRKYLKERGQLSAPAQPLLSPTCSPLSPSGSLKTALLLCEHSRSAPYSADVLFYFQVEWKENRHQATLLFLPLMAKPSRFQALSGSPADPDRPGWALWRKCKKPLQGQVQVGHARLYQSPRCSWDPGQSHTSQRDGWFSTSSTHSCQNRLKEELIFYFILESLNMIFYYCFPLLGYTSVFSRWEKGCWSRASVFGWMRHARNITCAHRIGSALCHEKQWHDSRSTAWPHVTPTSDLPGGLG